MPIPYASSGLPDKDVPFKVLNHKVVPFGSIFNNNPQANTGLSGLQSLTIKVDGVVSTGANATVLSFDVAASTSLTTNSQRTIPDLNNGVYSGYNPGNDNRAGLFLDYSNIYDNTLFAYPNRTGITVYNYNLIDKGQLGWDRIVDNSATQYAGSRDLMAKKKAGPLGKGLGDPGVGGCAPPHPPPPPYW